MDIAKVYLALLCIACCWYGASTQNELDVTLSPLNGVIGHNPFHINCILDEVVPDITVIQMSREDSEGADHLLIFYSLAIGDGGSWSNSSGDLGSRASFVVEPTPKPYLNITIDEVRCEDEALYKCQMIGGNLIDGIRTYDGDVMAELHAFPEALAASIAPLGPYVPGDRVNLTCAGNVGVPAGNITWFKYTDGDGTFVAYTDDITDYLTIHNETHCMYSTSSDLEYTVVSADYGLTFRCDVTNPTMAPVSTFQPLNLTVPGLSIDTTPDVGVVGNEMLTIKCITTLTGVNNFSYIEISRQEPPGGDMKQIAYINSAFPEWFSGNDALVGRADLYGSLLTESPYLNIGLRVVECDDQTQYSCEMIAGTPATGNTHIAGNGTITLHAKPDNMVVVADPDEHLVPGSSVVLTCAADVGTPAGNITWSRWTDPDGAWIPWTTDVVTDPEIQSSACMYNRTSTLSYTTVAGEFGLKFRCEVAHTTLLSSLMREIALDVPGPTTPTPPPTTTTTDPSTEAPPVTTTQGSDVVVIATTVSMVALLAVVALILVYMYATNKIGRKRVAPENTANRRGYENPTFSDDAPVEH